MARIWILTNSSDVKSHSLSRTEPDSRQSELEIWYPDAKASAGQMVQKRIIFGFRMSCSWSCLSGLLGEKKRNITIKYF